MVAPMPYRHDASHRIEPEVVGHNEVQYQREAIVDVGSIAVGARGDTLRRSSAAFCLPLPPTP
jgi:hypothetical protein